MVYSVVMEQRRDRQGFTLIELLVVVAIIGILVALIVFGIVTARQKAADTKIRSDVKQLRLLAEQTYDSNGASYLGWASHPAVVGNVVILQNDIDSVHGDAPGAPFQSVLIDTRDREFCISAELVAGGVGGDYLCVDASGETNFTSSHCSDPINPGDPLACPT